jgi:hypothetical protein
LHLCAEEACGIVTIPTLVEPYSVESCLDPTS